ncbi:hypothetical protein EYF80_042118 [Liparis tanakae]|uniref:Uncharacterized protein n=1 Tax=Liparis tanakae TaxID=230148 RepID=A0A4Z2G3Q6_9TELE|nr:hypothetical protein EYF80_042118 [Liparis tanakae]
MAAEVLTWYVVHGGGGSSCWETEKGGGSSGVSVSPPQSRCPTSQSGAALAVPGTVVGAVVVAPNVVMGSVAATAVVGGAMVSSGPVQQHVQNLRTSDASRKPTLFSSHRRPRVAPERLPPAAASRMAGVSLNAGRLVAQWKLTVQLAAQQLQAEAQALDGGPLRVDPDVAGQQGTHGPQLRGVVVLIPEEDLRRHGRQNEAKLNKDRGNTSGEDYRGDGGEISVCSKSSGSPTVDPPPPSLPRSPRGHLDRVDGRKWLPTRGSKDTHFLLGIGIKGAWIDQEEVKETETGLQSSGAGMNSLKMQVVSDEQEN